GEARAENPVHIGCVGDKDRSPGGIGDSANIGFEVIVPGSILQDKLISQPRKIISKAFIEPDILPTTARHVISKPLVGQFMRRETITKPSHTTHGLMFHSTAKPKLIVTVFFLVERVRNKQGFKQSHHIR